MLWRDGWPCRRGDGEDIWRAADRGLLAPAGSLDSLVAEHRLPRLDLLKIDVEGHRVEVLAGAADRLTRLLVLIFETAHETVGECHGPPTHWKLPMTTSSQFWTLMPL